MASNSIPSSRASLSARDFAGDTPTFNLREFVETALSPLASLKLTVLLLTLSTILVFLGTVAQWQKDIWVVVHEYFRCAIAWVPLDDCLPPKMWPGLSRPIPGGFYFPGGGTLLTLLAINLLAAHGIRFKIQAKGARLWGGLGVIAAGIVTTYLVILSGSSTSGVHSSSVSDWTNTWLLFKGGLAAAWLACVYGAIALPSERSFERWLTRGAVVALGLGLGWLFYMGDAARLDDSSLRILWQLAKATLAGLVLLAGCVMVFKQRGAVVVLHAGLGLMMVNELVVYAMHVESQMTIEEGQTSAFTQDIRQVEMAVIDKSNPEEDTVTIVPENILRQNFEKQQSIRSSMLPVDIKVVEYFKNSSIHEVKTSDPETAPGTKQNPATEGDGKKWFVKAARPGAGTDSNTKVDVSSAYVQLLDKNDGHVLGTHLVSLYQSMANAPEVVTVGDKKYEVTLRFKRLYKPYEVTLIDVRKKDYLGTDTPRDYSSDVRLVDHELGVDRKVHIWMNNPLRFRDETFYQSGYHRDERTGKESTTLQVVSNFGWMIPYVGCMIVVVGMVGQFGQTLTRFIRRREEGRTAETVTRKKSSHRDDTFESTPSLGIGETVLLGITLLVAVALIGYSARVPAPRADEMNLYEFGQIPVMFEGRMKPLDTLACTTLRVISNNETFVDETGKRQPAIKWLLDVVSGREYTNDKGEKLVAAHQHQVFKIDSLDVQGLLELKPRQRYRYGIDEFKHKLSVVEAELVKVKEKEKLSGGVSLSASERGLRDLETRLQRYLMVDSAFRPINLPPLPGKADFDTDPQKARERGIAIIQAYQQWSAKLEEQKPPRIIPAIDKAGLGDKDRDQWQIMAVAAVQDGFQKQIQGEKAAINPALDNLERLFDAYATGNAAEFNSQLARYQGSLASLKPVEYNAAKVNFEAFFNHFRPFYLCWWLYLLAFCLAGLSWLGWSQPLGRTAFWLIALVLVVHTVAIVARIYISGRPPVTNLYTTAIFIGWGCVVLGLILEAIYKMGIGNFVAAALGMVTLEIADRLAADGDTFTVLQAVLDTQFWLSTHVVCINLGYATTILSGALGLVYVLRGVLTPSLTPEVGKALGRMIYGTLCFAIFFSFWGTVLGGLWADDSWGRFWGWDPKENGALMIVLWNAIVLHARWGKIVGDRGMASLCIIGNIVTAWSWFAVNDLGIGLHAYGSTSGTFMKLYAFAAAMLMVVALGCIPRDKWWSSRTSPAV